MWLGERRKFKSKEWFLITHFSIGNQLINPLLRVKVLIKSELFS